MPAEARSIRRRVTAWFGQAIISRAARWARWRQGSDAAVTVLSARRTYILPTGIGLIYALMCFAMLLGSMNYNNNLSFVLTFLLIGVGFVAMHQCQRNLVGLRLQFAGVDPVFAGGVALFRFAVVNESRARRLRIGLSAAGEATPLADIGAGESATFEVPMRAPKRGRVVLPRLGIHSLYPFELFRSWAWLHLDVHGLAYPHVAADAPEPPSTLLAVGHRQHDARGEEDFAGLRRFVPGDSPRNVAWKTYARSGQLLSKHFAGADTSSQWFVFDDVPGADIERRLSILTRWIVDADRRREDYGLRLPELEIAPDHGAGHRERSLAALATFGIDD